MAENKKTDKVKLMIVSNTSFGYKKGGKVMQKKLEKGVVVNTDDEIARQLIDAGVAVPYESPKVKEIEL